MEIRMILPSPKQIGSALQQWRAVHGGLKQKDIAKRSVQLGKKLKTQQVGRWERGDQPFTYKQLVEVILPAYEIPDWDTFLDSCRDPSLKDVTVIAAKQFTTRDRKSVV